MDCGPLSIMQPPKQPSDVTSGVAPLMTEISLLSEMP